VGAGFAVGFDVAGFVLLALVVLFDAVTLMGVELQDGEAGVRDLLFEVVGGVEAVQSHFFFIFEDLGLLELIIGFSLAFYFFTDLLFFFEECLLIDFSYIFL
jgi:hypothetical protein